MAGDVHDVVDASEEPDVAVFVLLRAVAGKVHAFITRPVRLLEPLRVAPNPAQHAGPRLGENEIAARAVGYGLCAVVNDFRR